MVKIKMIEQIIELDCPPGNPRPGDLIGIVIKDLLPIREPTSCCFGNWSWNYNDIPEEQWKKVNSEIEKRIKQLYNKGSIRYGSW